MSLLLRSSGLLKLVDADGSRDRRNPSFWSAALQGRSALVRAIVAFCVFEIAFYFAYRHGMAFSQAVASPFWFPDSVLLCALLLSRPGAWPFFILGALPIRLLSEVAHDIPVWFLITTWAIDSARNLITALVLRRVLKDPIRFETVQEFAAFCLWAVFVMPATAAVGGALARQALGDNFWSAWERWFLGNAITHLVVTPAILYWVFRPSSDLRAVSVRRWLEVALLAIGLVLSGYVAFDTAAGTHGFVESRFYAPVPFLFWAAIRFGMSGASASIVVIAVLAVEAALEGRGPFAGQSPADTALELQHFLLLRAAPLYLVAILIEQRKRVEQTLRESQERMTLAAMAADLWLWEWDLLEDQIWLTNPGRGQDGVGRFAPMRFDAFIQTVHSDDRPAVMDGVAKCMGGADYDGKYRITLGGRLRWIATVGRIELDPSGKPVRIRGFSRDITRSQQVEQQVQQQRDELAQLSRVAALGELSGSLAHELNQPLTAILTNAQAAQRFLAQGRGDPNDIREILSDIVADDQRAAEIIQRLRQLFKRGQIQRQPMAANELVGDALRLAQSELAGHAIDVRTELADDLPPISGDRVQLQQLLLNLIANACNAMADVAPAGRRLLVRTAAADGDGVRVTVADSGAGIPPECLPRIFEPFFTTRAEGMGLGLTVCRTIISGHRGQLWAENNLDHGASFHFVVPRSETSES
jgi:signal transduction histidine kinase/integral membrane sensor domain MASE1